MTAPRLIAVVLGVVGGIVTASLGTPGLIALSFVLLAGVLWTRVEAALFVASAGAVSFLAYAIAFVRCEPTLGRTCTLDDGSGLMIAWAGTLVVAAIGATWIARRRHRVAR